MMHCSFRLAAARLRAPAWLLQSLRPPLGRASDSPWPFPGVLVVDSHSIVSRPGPAPLDRRLVPPPGGLSAPVDDPGGTLIGHSVDVENRSLDLRHAVCYQSGAEGRR